MKGLRNLGSSCYLNAALQCLLHAPQLTNYFLSECVQDDLQRKRLNACQVAAEYGALAAAFWRDDAKAPLDTAPLHAALAKVHRPFGRAANGPHDAHEAMLVLLRCLHDALSKTAPVQQSLAAPHVAAEAWDAHSRAGGYSMLTEIFQGQLEVTVAGAAYASTTHEHFWDLGLAVDECTSVQQALQRFLAPETVDGFRVEDGSTIQARLTKTPLWLPLVLIVHLKRFDAARRRKIDKFVDYPADLDLSGCVRSNSACRYSLFGVCLHAGDLGAGHYTALVEVRGRWFHANDEVSTPMDDLNALIQKDAYVLLYKKDLAF